METNYNPWRKDKDDSIVAIKTLELTILPELISKFTGINNCKIISIEKSEDIVLTKFDQSSGIDLISQNNKGIQTIASRAQWGKDYQSFTIRYERTSGSQTEYEKRLIAIKEGYDYPQLTMQAFFDDRKTNNLRSIGLIKTTDLYSFTEINIDNPYLVHRKTSDNPFLTIYWKNLSGYKLEIYPIIEEEEIPEMYWNK